MPAPIIFVVAIAVGAVLFWYSRSAAASIDLGAGSSIVPVPTEIPSSWTPPARAQPYLGAIAEAEARNGLPHNLLARQLDIESDHFSADVIDGSRRGSSGEIGIGQYMPATAEAAALDPSDPFASIEQAARDDRAMFDRYGSWQAALAAYNWGSGNLDRKGIDAAPAMTVSYYTKILAAAGIA